MLSGTLYNYYYYYCDVFRVPCIVYRVPFVVCRVGCESKHLVFGHIALWRLKSGSNDGRQMSCLMQLAIRKRLCMSGNVLKLSTYF